MTRVRIDASTVVPVCRGRAGRSITPERDAQPPQLADRRPTMAAASIIVSSRFMTRAKIHARRCSLDATVIVVSIPGD
jgi:hypothetical protein